MKTGLRPKNGYFGHLVDNWVLYMLEAVEVTAGQTLQTVQAIKAALMDYKHRIREQHKFYSQDLINNLSATLTPRSSSCNVTCRSPV